MATLEEEEILTEEEDEDEVKDEEGEDLDGAPLAPEDDFWCCESAAAVADDEGEPSSEMEMEERLMKREAMTANRGGDGLERRTDMSFTSEKNSTLT